MAWKVIGVITCAVAGTRTRLTSTQTDPTKAYPCQSWRVEAVIANTGAVSVGDSTSVASSQVGVAAVLPKCAATGPTSVVEMHAYSNPNGLDLSAVYIDVATGGDKVLVSVNEG
jgi:hypothetical protein